MKRLASIVVSLMSVATLAAQQPYKAYCKISGYHFQRSRVEIDYGQAQTKKNYLVDDNGKALEHYSVAAAANQLSKFGWVVEESYAIGEDNRHEVWVLSKLVTDDSQITEGFMTRKMYEDGDNRPTK